MMGVGGGGLIQIGKCDGDLKLLSSEIRRLRRSHSHRYAGRLRHSRDPELVFVCLVSSNILDSTVNMECCMESRAGVGAKILTYPSLCALANDMRG